MKRYLFLIAALALLASCAQPTPKADDHFVSDGVVYELNTRQFTPEGTFDAAREQLPRLKELGVDVVWLMPIYPIGELGRKGSLGSYYAIKNYCDVNPEFGTLEDFDEFVAEAHKLGLKVILDWVANHTAPDHPWVTEQDPGWYYRDSLGRTIVEYDWTDIAKLNYSSEGVRAAMKQQMEFWVARGVDGFRCDVAYLVPKEFWKPTIASLREQAGKPFYMLAEAEEDWMFDAGFNSMYAWRLHHILNDIAQGTKGKAELLEEITKYYVSSPDGNRMAFTSNHDENSWSGTEFERMGDAVKAMSILCWTLPNSQPLIYTGQEVGYDRRFAFFEKDIAPTWVDNEWTDFYKYLAEFKHAHPALDSDAAFEVIPSDSTTIVFKRTKDGDVVTVSVELQAPWTWSLKTGADRISQVEPLCWWTGMKTPLQLMVHGEGIRDFDVWIEGGKGVRATVAHEVESPNYLFIDVEIDKTAKPGTYQLCFANESEQFSVPYELLGRRTGSAKRTSFTTADLMYLIMPDRFVNADPSNDSTPDTFEKAAPDEFFGRHGGDIAGIRSQLGYLQDLGVTALWNTPLLEDNVVRESYHGYACTDYYHIDSRFGTNEDYRALVQDAHAHGIKMIMDIVPNHCGDTHWWMKDLPFQDWVHQWPEYTHSNCAFSTQNDSYAAVIDRENFEGGWFDRAMVDMNLDNPFLLRYFQQWAIWWVEWADLDGLRVDTYPYNEKYPMSEWCAAVRNEYPNINIVGEVWTNNVPQLVYWQAGALNRDGFDSNLPAVMDFPLQTAILEALNYNGRVNWNEGMVRVYDCMADRQFYADPDNVLVFPGNHDQERIADCVGRDDYRVKAAMALVATLPGIPQVLYADELGAVSKDRSQGHGGLRIDFPLDWQSDSAAVDMHDYFKTLFNWRKGCKAVTEGSMKHFLRRDNTYAYFRYLPDMSDVVFVYINNGEEGVQIPWADYKEVTDALPEGTWTNIITGEMIYPNAMNMYEKDFMILQFNPEQ